jgi:hypothetical protein
MLKFSQGRSELPFGSSVVMTAYYNRFYFDRDALARRMTITLAKLPRIEELCRIMFDFDISWRSGGSLNAYLLPVIAVRLLAPFCVQKYLIFLLCLKTRHDVHECAGGEIHKTLWNQSDVDCHDHYKITFLSNDGARLLKLAQLVFGVIASG